MQEEVTNTKLYLYMLGMLISGSYDTIALKLQSQENAIGRDGGPERPYYHPFFQTATMFLGQTMNLALYFILRTCEKRRVLKLAGDMAPEERERLLNPEEHTARLLGKRSDINPILMAIPALFDTVASTLVFIGLTRVAASVYQMMRGLIVFYTALFSIAFLRRRLYRHHFTSLLFIVGGVAIVGVAPIVLDTSGEGSSTDSEVFGIVLIVLSQLF